MTQNVTTRFVFALAAAPLAPAIVFTVLGSGFLPAIVAAVCSYVAFTFLGLPAVLALRHYHRLNVLSILAAGAVLGALSWIAIMTWFTGAMGYSNLSAFSALTSLCGAAFGVLVAGTFTAIAGPQNLRSRRIVQS
jgi:hypothetical protein